MVLLSSPKEYIVKTSELIGPALDWAVAKCEQVIVDIGKRGQVFFDTYENDPPAGVNEYNDNRWQMYSPSTDWAQGGPIIEREKLSVTIQQGDPPLWFASCPRYYFKSNGPTPIIAAMRCYVASKLGDEIEIPEELTM